MRKTGLAIIICIISCMLLAGCANGKKKADISGKLEEAKTKPQEQDEPGPGDDDTDEKAPEKASKGNKVDLGSEKSIREYLAGEWTFLDRDNGEDYGTLTIDKDGSFEFTRFSDNATGSGKLSFDHFQAEEGDEPDEFRLEFDDCEELVPADMELYGNERTDGIFHVGSFGDEDYLYLKEIGNGESVVSMYIFNTDEEAVNTGNWSYDWLFYREASGENTEDVIKDDTFYAWAWERDDDDEGVWLQPMEEHEYETFEDYSNRRFLGGYFSEKEDISVAYYELADKTDLDGIMNMADWDTGYPLMMCKVTADKNGDIKEITDVDIAMYNVYDMGDLEPEFSYKGTTFTIEGVDIDITEYAPAANAITECKHVGDWIIVTCHVNPNMNTYLFYNINNGLMDCFEYQITGVNLIWQGDDLSTAVYSRYNEIYDFWGHLIGNFDEGQLYDLAFKDETTILAEGWEIDKNGEERYFNEEFEYEPCDRAVFEYYEYQLGGSRQFRELQELSEDAAALIIVNPPEGILNRMGSPVVFAKGAYDRVCVIPLADDATVSIEPTKYAMSESTRKITDQVGKGRAIVYEVTVSEGLPAAVITLKEPGYGEVTWDVLQLSGRCPQMSTFIKQEGNKQ